MQPSANANTFEIRVTKVSELSQAQIGRLAALVNTAYAKNSHLLPEQRTSASSYPEEVGDSDLILAIDTLSGEIIATAYVHPDNSDGNALYLGMAAVDPKYQGRGLGRRMLQATEELARQRGRTKVRLIAVEEIGNAAYYLQFGYRVVATENQPKGTWGSLAPFTNATMEKEI